MDSRCRADWLGGLALLRLTNSDGIRYNISNHRLAGLLTPGRGLVGISGSIFYLAGGICSLVGLVCSLRDCGRRRRCFFLLLLRLLRGRLGLL